MVGGGLGDGGWMSFLPNSLPDLSSVKEPLAFICYPTVPLSLVSFDYPHPQYLQAKANYESEDCALSQ